MIMKSKIVIAGGSGFIGQLLSDFYHHQNYEVVVLSRGNREKVHGIRFVNWDGETEGEWVKELEGCDTVINLTGKSVNCRPTKSNNKAVIDSRVRSTKVIGKAIQKLQSPPKVWINAGGVGVFSGADSDVPKDENAALGKDFSSEVAYHWEKAFNEAETPLTRKVFLRIALVLKKGEGFLQPMELLVKTGLGGTMGSGKQHFPWIHYQDLIQIFDYVRKSAQMSGVVHAVSPETVSNASFMKQLRQAIGVPIGIPAPAFAVRLGAYIIGTNGNLALSDNPAIPGKLIKEQYSFLFPDLKSALAQLYSGK